MSYLKFMMNAVIIAEDWAYERVFSLTFLEKLKKEVVLLSKKETADSFLKKPDLIDQTQIIIGSWGMVHLNASLLLRMPQLKAVFYAAGSVKGFLSTEFWKQKITLSSAVEANSIPVSEITFAHVILALKNYWKYTLQLKGIEKFKNPPDCFGCYHSKVGLVSLGSIGRRVLDRLKTLDVDVFVYDPFLTSQKAQEIGVKSVSLEKLFIESDVVTIHAPWLPETERMIQKSHILSLKQGATLINTARGAVIDEPGMVEALQERTDLWAVLDVTHPEPPVPGSLLYTLPNVLLSPHLAGSMSNECHRMADWMLDELIRFQKGESLRYSIREKDLARMA